METPFARGPRSPWLFPLLSLLLLCSCRKQLGDIASTELRSADQNWLVWHAPGSETAEIEVTSYKDPDTDLPAVRARSNRIARYGLLARWNPVSVTAGKRYKISAWVKGDADTGAAAGSPGILLRATLLLKHNTAHPLQFYYVGTQGVAAGDTQPLNGSTIPLSWTKLEAIVEMPAGVTECKLWIFGWHTTGTLYARDLALVPVADTVALSPLRGK